LDCAHLDGYYTPLHPICNGYPATFHPPHPPIIPSILSTVPLVPPQRPPPPLSPIGLPSLPPHPYICRLNCSLPPYMYPSLCEHPPPSEHPLRHSHVRRPISEISENVGLRIRRFF
jgi:hypothetical protein